MKKINLQLVVAQECPTCTKIEKKLRNFLKLYEHISLSILDIETNPLGASIVPAVYINQTLYGYGDVDLQKLTTAIN